MISTYEILCKDFSSLMSDEFEMSLMEEQTYFLRLQSKLMMAHFSTRQSIAVSMKFDMQNSKNISIFIMSNVLIDKDENDIEINITKYRDIIESKLYLTAIGP